MSWFQYFPLFAITFYLFQIFSTCIGTFWSLMQTHLCCDCETIIRGRGTSCLSASRRQTEPCSKPIFHLTGVWLTRLHCGPPYHCLWTLNTNTQIHKDKMTLNTNTQIQEPCFNPIALMCGFRACTALPFHCVCPAKTTLLNKSLQPWRHQARAKGMFTLRPRANFGFKVCELQTTHIYAPHRADLHHWHRQDNCAAAIKELEISFQNCFNQLYVQLPQRWKRTEGASYATIDYSLSSCCGLAMPCIA